MNTHGSSAAIRGSVTPLRASRSGNYRVLGGAGSTSKEMDPGEEVRHRDSTVGATVDGLASKPVVPLIFLAGQSGPCPP